MPIFQALRSLAFAFYRAAICAALVWAFVSPNFAFAKEFELSAQKRQRIFPALTPKLETYWCYQSGARSAVSGKIKPRKGREYFVANRELLRPASRVAAKEKVKRLDRACKKMLALKRFSLGFTDGNSPTYPVIFGPSSYEFPSPTAGGSVLFEGINFSPLTKIFLVSINNQLVSPPVEVPSIYLSPDRLRVDVGGAVNLTVAVMAAYKVQGNFTFSNVHELSLSIAQPTPTPSPSPTPTASPTPNGALLYSNPSIWPNNTVPQAGQDVTIPVGATIILDTNTADLGNLTIRGTLLADPSRDLNITAANIRIPMGGKFQVGSPQVPYDKKMIITVTGARGTEIPRSEDNGIDMNSSREIMVMGELLLYGKVNGTQIAKLNDHASAGSSAFQLDRNVNWKAGDEIAVSLTDFYGVGVTEKLTLAANTNNGSVLYTTTPVNTFRWGKLQYPLDVPVGGTAVSLTPGTFTPPSPTTSRVIDERATIVNLTRNIVIQGKNDAAWTTHGYGAHLMIMGLGSRVIAEGIEMRRVGQRRIMGRYPWHWHMLSYTSASSSGIGGGAYVADVAPDSQILRSSSIHDSANRAVTIHATNGVTVADNVVFDIKGHAIFEEDGNERRNVISGNVVMKVRDPGAAYRIKRHDADASGFWLTNPDNVVANNTASDCDGRGLWNSFATQLFGFSRNGVMNPSTLDIGLFEGNTGHSNRQQGIATELVVYNEAGDTMPNRYTGSGPFTLSRNRVYKNNEGGYINRVGQAQYVDWEAYDNNGRDFAGQTLWAKMTGTLLVGKTLNSATPFSDPRRIGLASYHYTIDIEDIVAINYPYYPPTMAANGQFVYGGGVFDPSDLYAAPGVALGGARNSGWKLINSHPGHISPAPYFDGFPITVAIMPPPNNNRHWTLPGAHWDPHGYWGAAGNYLIPNLPFYTYGISGGQVVQPTSMNILSTPHKFLGLTDIVYNNPAAADWETTAVPLRVGRLNTSNVEIAEHLVGDPATTIFFPGYRNIGAANGGRYRMTFPGLAPPTTYLRLGIVNAAAPTDELVLCVPWGAATVSGRIDAGIGSFTVAYRIQTGTTKLLSFTGTSLNSVIADPTGVTAWHDVQNSSVCLKHKGGMNFPSHYNSADPLSDMKLEMVHFLRLYP